MSGLSLLRDITAADAATVLRLRHRPAGFLSADAWASMADVERARLLLGQLPRRMSEAAHAVGKYVYSLSHHRDESIPAGAFLIEAMQACAHEARLAYVVIHAAEEAAAQAEERAERKAKRTKVQA